MIHLKWTTYSASLPHDGIPLRDGSVGSTSPSRSFEELTKDRACILEDLVQIQRYLAHYDAVPTIRVPLSETDQRCLRDTFVILLFLCFFRRNQKRIEKKNEKIRNHCRRFLSHGYNTQRWRQRHVCIHF